jgi:glycosyltransferase involved in cell wall biosynthesis|tara:strand:+ start:504 stop:1706 length:1203 start_codon:yes stop_codon:yes gene_type:complete
MESMKVGIVGLHWPPDWGGAERYVSRVVDALNNHGVEAWGITPRHSIEGMDNGTEYVHRLGDFQPFGINDSKNMLNFWNHLYDHVEEGQYTHLIFNNCHVFSWAFEDVINRLKEMNVKVGIFHFDVLPQLRLPVAENYHYEQDWEKALYPVVTSQKALFEIDNPLFTEKHAHYIINSPLFFNPDFVVSCSKWVERFIDPTDKLPKFVLHPPLGETNEPTTKLDRVNITMINPQYHKGRSYMADIINEFNNKWTYRVLLGGYGGDKQEFVDMIADSWAVRDGRVEIVPYVEQIEDALCATDLFIFPSRFEGYGMAAVEPMIHGVPVMVQNYPSVIEAVGDGAIIMPYGQDSKEWVETIEELFFDDEEYEEFKEKGYKRVQQLKDREHEEMKNFITFMENIA